MKATYRAHLISYVDILGFRQLITRSQTDQNLVHEIDSQLSKFIEWLSQFGPADKLHSFNFSDHVVRATEVEDGEDLGKHLDREAYYIAERQLQMAMKGWFLRGSSRKTEGRLGRGISQHSPSRFGATLSGER